MRKKSTRHLSCRIFDTPACCHAQMPGGAGDRHSIHKDEVVVPGCEWVLGSESVITLKGFRKPNTLFPQMIGPSAVRALDHSWVAKPEVLFIYLHGDCHLDRW